MAFKIVSDSSSNVFTMKEGNYTTVPMKVIAGEHEFVDTPELDVQNMVNILLSHKGPSGSSCPNVQEWLDAFEGEDDILGVTISSNLSGSHNSAAQAAREFMQTHPGRKAYIFDTLSAGPEQAMLVDELTRLIAQGHDFDTVVELGNRYLSGTHILFCLESMNNLARNGRVSPAAAKIASVLGIRAVGDAEGGQIIPVHKPRGHKKAIATLVQMMEERGLKEDGYVRIAHCFGQQQAEDLKAATLAKHPGVRFVIEPTTALCSFYAEVGGLMIGMEGDYNTVNHPDNF